MAENDIIDDGGVIKEAEEKKPLGEQLLEKGALSEDQLRIALFEQQSSGDPLGRILVRLGFVTEATIRDMLSETGDAKVVDLRNISVDPDVLARVPIDVAKQYNIFPINYDEVKKMISIAVANPNDLLLADQIRAFLGGDYDLEFMVAEESEIVVRWMNIMAWSLRLKASCVRLKPAKKRRPLLCRARVPPILLFVWSMLL